MDYKKLGGRIQTRVINAILGGGEMFISQIHKQNLFFDDGGVAPLGFFLAPAISFLLVYLVLFRFTFYVTRSNNE